MKFIVSVLLIGVFAAVAEYFLPWWSVAVVAFVVTFFMGGKGGWGFLSGFSGVGILWVIAALLHDGANDHILSGRMAVLFKLPSYGLFICVTVLVGGLVGGLAGWAGALLSSRD
jgi:hypothetical protein